MTNQTNKLEFTYEAVEDVLDIYNLELTKEFVTIFDPYQYEAVDIPWEIAVKIAKAILKYDPNSSSELKFEQSVEQTQNL